MTTGTPRWGTDLDTFLTENNIQQSAKATAITRLVAWQLTREMHAKASPNPRSQPKCKPAALNSTASLKPKAT